MNDGRLGVVQNALEKITRRWWFFLLMVLLQFIPPYTTKGYDPAQTGMVTGNLLAKAIVFDLPAYLYPIFKVIPLALIVGIIILKERMPRLFSIYAAISYILFAFLQSIAITDEYGLGIVVVNLVMFLLVAASWAWEAVVQRNRFVPRRQPLWKYWVVPLAFLAFWYPARYESGAFIPDFNPLYIFTNVAGLAFCLMTPVYLAVLTLYHPEVNRVPLRVTGLVGILIGLYNMLLNFGMNPAQAWWNGVLHIPLLSISIYAFVLSFLRGGQE